MIILGYANLKQIDSELQTVLSGGQLQAIHQPRHDLITLKIHSPGHTYTLLFSVNSCFPRIYLTKEKWQNPSHPPAFCQNLRKHLLNRRVMTIDMLPDIPVISLVFYSTEINDNKKLLLTFELYGQFSNLLLIESKEAVSQHKIIYCLKSFTSPFRVVKPGEEYHPPQARKNFFAGNIKANAIMPQPEDSLFTEAEPLAFNFALDRFFKREIDSQNAISLYQRIQKQMQKERKRQKQKLQKLTNRIKEVENGFFYQKYGELIHAQLWSIPPKAREVKLIDYYDENREIKIKLDPNKNAAENAAAYFEKYKKLKAAKPPLAKFKAKAESQLQYIDALSEKLPEAKTANLNELTQIFTELGGIVEQTFGTSRTSEKNSLKKSRLAGKQSDTSKFRQFSCGDWQIIVGRDSKQNDLIITRIGRSHDYWLHARDFSGSHTLLKVPHKNANPPLDVLLTAAAIAGFYSKARKESKTEVIYTRLKNVFKRKGDPKGAAHCKQFKSLLVSPKLPLQES